jgi:DNA-binding transcriptional regulator LsrR (DeoR family)
MKTEAEIMGRIQSRIDIYRQKLQRLLSRLDDDNFESVSLEAKIEELVSLKRELLE